MQVAGFEIPSESPVFLAVLAIHVPIGLLAVVAGAAAMLAFYVDNGKSLLILRDLPRLAYWLVPSGVGISLIVRALLRYREPLTIRKATALRSFSPRA